MEAFKEEGLNWDPIMPRDNSLSDSRSNLFQSGASDDGRKNEGVETGIQNKKQFLFLSSYFNGISKYVKFLYLLYQ